MWTSTETWEAHQTTLGPQVTAQADIPLLIRISSSASQEEDGKLHYGKPLRHRDYPHSQRFSEYLNYPSSRQWGKRFSNA